MIRLLEEGHGTFRGLLGRFLFFPDNVKWFAEVPSLEELKQRASAFLGDTAACKELVLENLVPLIIKLANQSSQHLLECRVEPLDHPISLRVICRHPD